jgi:hypothetical protein
MLLVPKFRPLISKALRLCLSSVLCLLSSVLWFSSPALSWDRPFDWAANWGGTGLLEMPSARVLDDGVIRLSIAQALPYRWYTGGMGIFPGLEFSGRVTQITNIPSGLGPGYGSNKDKAIDLKYQVIPESKWLPALALGYDDLYGTQQFEAQYIVINRQIFPFDFTLGYGNKRINGLFGGVEVALHPRVHFVAEYSPIDYSADNPSVRGVPEGADSPINFGLRCKILPTVVLGISYQRGDTLGATLTFQAPIGNPVLPQRADPPPQVDVNRKPYSERDPKQMVQEIHDAVSKAGFTDVLVYTDGENLTAEFVNNLYLSDQKAVGRVLRLLLLHSPGDTKRLVAVLNRQGVPILKVSVKPDALEAYLFGEISEEIFSRLITVESTKEGLNRKDPDVVYAGGKDAFYSYGIKPDVEFYLNDPSGFFKYRVGVKPWSVLDLWKGGEAYALFDVPFYSDISSSNIPPNDTVREDSWKYLGLQYTFTSLLFDQVYQFTDRTYGRMSFGYLEYMYAGASGEVLHFFGDGNIALGLQGDWARKREPGSTMALTDFDFYDVLANGYFRVPYLDVTLQAQYGRFMAGDVGWLFTGSREYDTGVVIGAWWSFTDTSDLQGFSKNYNNKGIFITLPARIFMSHDSPIRYTYSVSPWTRDAAQTPWHWRTIWDIAGDLMPGTFRSKLGQLKE